MTQAIVSHHKIIITIPVFNEVQFIEETLESIRNQSYRDFKVFITDNASTDGTSDIAKKFCLRDHRFTYVRQSHNIGAFDNFMYSLAATDSEYVMMFSGHDLIAPTFLEKHVKNLDANPEVSLSYSQTHWIDHNSNIIQTTTYEQYALPATMSPAQRYVSFLENLSWCEVINHPFRRKFLKGFKTRPVISVDQILLCHLQAFGPFKEVKEPLYLRRYFEGRENNTERMERLTGKKEDSVNFLEYAMDFINNARTHPNISENERAALIWVLTQVLDIRFNIFHQYKIEKVYTPVAETINI